MPFEIVRNDITKMKVDAIVNAANTSLLGGGGVDGAIHRAAGPELLAECRTLGGCDTGDAKITGGYNLPAKYVIHTVGPVWYGGSRNEPELLASCYRRSLELAVANACESVAFPMISAGAYGYPKDRAMNVAVQAITDFLLDHDIMVYLVVFGREEFCTGKKLFLDVREYIDDVYAEQRIENSIEQKRRRLWHESKQAALELDHSIAENMAAPQSAPFSDAFVGSAPAAPLDWDELLGSMDEGFSGALLRLISEKGLTDVECYKRANVDRKLFSKIRSNPGYRPGKPTVFAFAVALKLNLEETKDLLRKAGFALTRSSKLDIILEYCISHKEYDVFEINEVLFQYDLPLLGSGMN